MTEAAQQKPLPTPEQFFAQSVNLAGIARQSLMNAEKLREELHDKIEEFGKMKSELVEQITKQQEELRKTYAPAAMENAARASQATAARFESQTDAVFEKVTSRADRAATGFLLRTIVWTVAIVAAVTFCVWLALQTVPTLTEIADRRATVRALQDQIGALNRDFESLKGRFVLVEGQWYARTWPGKDPVSICPDGTPRDNCPGPYVLIR